MMYCVEDDVKAYSKIAYTDSAYNTFLNSLIALAQAIINNSAKRMRSLSVTLNVTYAQSRFSHIGRSQTSI